MTDAFSTCDSAHSGTASVNGGSFAEIGACTNVKIGWLGNSKDCQHHQSMPIYTTHALADSYQPTKQATKDSLSHSTAPFSTARLVLSDERRHSLALVLVERVGIHRPVSDIGLALRLTLPCERVLHPVDVVAIGEIFAGVCS